MCFPWAQWNSSVRIAFRCAHTNYPLDSNFLSHVMSACHRPSLAKMSSFWSLKSLVPWSLNNWEVPFWYGLIHLTCDSWSFTGVSCVSSFGACLWSLRFHLPPHHPVTWPAPRRLRSSRRWEHVVPKLCKTRHFYTGCFSRFILAKQFGFQKVSMIKPFNEMTLVPLEVIASSRWRTTATKVLCSWRGAREWMIWFKRCFFVNQHVQQFLDWSSQRWGEQPSLSDLGSHTS